MGKQGQAHASPGSSDIVRIRKHRSLGDISEADKRWHCSLDSPYCALGYAIGQCIASSATTLNVKSLPLKRLRWWAVLDESCDSVALAGVFVIYVPCNISTFFAKNPASASVVKEPAHHQPWQIQPDRHTLQCSLHTLPRANFWPCAHEDPVASQCCFHFIEAQRRKKTNSLSLSALIGKSHTQGEKRTVPAAHFIQVAAPQRWSHGCKHSVAVCWEHMQHERLMQRAENGGRQPWLLAISLRDVLLLEEWMDPWNKMDQGPHVPLRTQDLEVDLPVTTWCWRTNFPWECTVHDCKSLWLLAEHLSYVPVMRQGLGAVPSKYQGRVKSWTFNRWSGESLSSPFSPLASTFLGYSGEILLAYGYLQNPQETCRPTTLSLTQLPPWNEESY